MTKRRAHEPVPEAGEPIYHDGSGELTSPSRKHENTF